MEPPKQEQSASTEEDQHHPREDSGLPRRQQSEHTEADPRLAKEESYWNRQVFWQRVTAIATIAAFIAAALYVHRAHQQVTVMQNQVAAMQKSVNEQAKSTNAAIEANSIAHLNAVEDLRAYVSVGTTQKGATQSESIELIHGPSQKPSIRIRFVNEGRTPARHFSVSLWSNVKTVDDFGKPLQQGQGYRLNPQWAYSAGMGKFRTRLQVVNCPYQGAASETIVCKQTSKGLGGQDETIGSQDQIIEDLPDKWTPPTDAFLGSVGLVVYGVFEYCDVFGQHHCDSFQYMYEKDKDRLVSVPLGEVAVGAMVPPLCFGSALLNDPVLGPYEYNGKKYQWTELPRCEQPTEKEYSEQ